MSKEQTRTLTVNIGRTVSEYDNFEIDVLVNASRQDILDAAREGLDAYLNDDDNTPFCDGPDLSTSREMRITGIDDSDSCEQIVDYTPVDEVASAVGDNVITAVESFSLGALTENQLILETLNSVYHNTPDTSAKNAFIKPLIAAYTEKALEDTRQKVGTILRDHEGILCSQDQKIALTIRSGVGESVNINVLSPGAIVHDDEGALVYYPYRDHKTGEVALVNRDPSGLRETVIAVYSDGSMREFDDMTSFNREANLSRVMEVTEGVGIIKNIMPSLDIKAPVRYAGRPEDVERCAPDPRQAPV